MHIDLCASDDYTTQAALLEAFAHVGAYPDEDFELAVPLPTGLLPFRAGTDLLTVFVDAWSIDLDGPDELVARVLEAMAARE